MQLAGEFNIERRVRDLEFVLTLLTIVVACL